MGFAVDDPMALQNGGAADRLGQMALAGARWPKEKDVLALLNETGGGQLVDQRPVHLLVEIQIKGVQRAVGIAEARVLDPPRDQAVLAADQFIADEGGDQVNGRLLLRLRLAEPRVEDVGHAGEAQLAEAGIELDKVHVGSPVC